MVPDARITINGEEVHSVFKNRLISITITDNSGLDGDTISCDLSDGYPFARIPKKGDKLKVWLGYKGSDLTYFGEYVIESPTVHCLPYGISVNAKSASMRDTLKQQKTRHWDNKSLKDIASEIAAEHALKVAVSENIGAYQYDWLAQQGESDLNFCQRMASRHGAVFSIKNGTLILSKRGTGYSASGKDLPIAVLTPNDIQPGTCDIEFSDREKVKQVRARHYDKKKAQLVNVEADSSSSGTAVHSLPHTYADANEAQAAATAKASALYMETTKARLAITGNPAIRAGIPFVFSGVRIGIDDIPFIVDSAVHSFSKFGYATAIEAHMSGSENQITVEKQSQRKGKKVVKLINVEK